MLTRDHWTKEVQEWEIIAIAMGGLYGIQFLLSLVSLSEFLYPVTAFYFEHVVSNAMIPLHLFVIYKVVEVAVVTDGLWQMRTAWIVFFNMIATYFAFAYNTYALYFLKTDETYQDEWLLPSIFYLFGWSSHQHTC